MTIKSNVHKETLNKIDHANHMVREITHQSRHLEPLRTGRRGKRSTAGICAIRGAAMSLYNTLLSEERWTCVCREQHFVTLRLEQRPLPATTNTSHHLFRILCARSNDDNEDLSTFRVFEIKQVDVVSTNIMPETIPSTSKTVKKTVQFMTEIPDSDTDYFYNKDTSNHQLIVDICREVYLNQNMDETPTFLLELEGKKKHYMSKSEYREAGRGQFRSLNEMLTTFKHGYPETSLYRGDRLRIAVTLSSSLLQLTGTPWLDSGWTSEDIRFDQDLIIQDPYLPWKRCAGMQSRPSNPPVIPSNDRRNTLLLSLGLTLVELCFGRTLADLYLDGDGDPRESSTKVCTATRLLRTIDREMGDLYSNVVRRCILQPFDVLDIDLNDEIVQQKVYEDIILPLTESLEAFSGQKKLS